MCTRQPQHTATKFGRWLLLIALAFTLAACSVPGVFHKPAPAGTGTRTPGGATVDLGRQGRAPAVKGAISMVGQCKQTEHDGYVEDATVRVDNGRVSTLDWRIVIPRRGTCRFESAQFRQTKTAPSVELLALNGSGCKLLMWGDPRRVTLAHAGCAKFCTPGAYDKAWPVMFNPKTGRCADIRR